MTVSSRWAFTKSITKSVPYGTCNYNYGGVPDLSNCVTIKPAPGQSLTFDVNGTNQTQVVSCVSGLSIRNATWTMTTYTDSLGDTVSNTALATGSGDNSCGTTSAPHDDYYSNNVYGGQAAIVGGVSNVYIVGDTAVSTADLDWQFGGFGNNGTLGPTTASGVIGVTFEGYNFANTDPGHHHMERMHENGALTNGFIAGNVWEQCPIESLFMETLNSASVITGNIIENNYFDASGGGGPFKLDCAQNGCTFSNNIIRFNSFNGGWSLECSASSAGGCDVNNNLFYGNLGIGCVGVAYSHGGSINGSGWVDQGYNVQTVAKANTCTSSTSSYSQPITYAAPGSPSYNLDLSGTTAASNFVPSSMGWPLSHANIHGAARSGASTNAGAY